MGGLDGDALAATQALVGPEVVPVSAGGQVDGLGGLALFGHGSDQQCGAEHVLIADVGHVGVVAEVKKETAHKGSAGLVRLPAKRVEIGHQLIAKTEVFLQDRFRLLAVAPDLVVRACAVGAEVGLEGAVLEPAGVELGVVVVEVNVVAGVGRVQQRRVLGLVGVREGACQPPMSVDQ